MRSSFYLWSRRAKCPNYSSVIHRTIVSALHKDFTLDRLWLFQLLVNTFQPALPIAGFSLSGICQSRLCLPKLRFSMPSNGVEVMPAPQYSLPDTLERIYENQLALEAALMELTLLVEC